MHPFLPCCFVRAGGFLVLDVRTVPWCNKQECCQPSLAYNGQCSRYMTEIGTWTPSLNHWLDRCRMFAKTMVWTWLTRFNSPAVCAFVSNLCRRATIRKSIHKMLLALETSGDYSLNVRQDYTHQINRPWETRMFRGTQSSNCLFGRVHVCSGVTWGFSPVITCVVFPIPGAQSCLHGSGGRLFWIPFQILSIIAREITKSLKENGREGPEDCVCSSLVQ